MSLSVDQVLTYKRTALSQQQPGSNSNKNETDNLDQYITGCLTCAYMLYSSINYVRNPEYGPKFGLAVVAGLVIMAAGVPLYYLSKNKKDT